MRVTLLRHSFAERVDNDDFNRALTSQGKEKALKIALSMKDLDVDTIICSPALRTTQTAKPIARELKCNLTFEPKLYNADFFTMQQVLDDLPEDRHSLVVGHNPGISQIATALDRSIYNSFEPCQGATFEKKGTQWYLLTRWP